MAKDGKQSPQKSDNAATSLLNRCLVEGCGKKASRMSFCNEHYQWFKDGLISKEGIKPKDFDKKHQAYLRRNKSAA
ncbi:MAG: hypothetical protein KDD35_01660 [Bdellovibrionales bacterium]|nr:hypothetical protein [Bdellovibrionales bacterium]